MNRHRFENELNFILIKIYNIYSYKSSFQNKTLYYKKRLNYLKIGI